MAPISCPFALKVLDAVNTSSISRDGESFSIRAVRQLKGQHIQVYSILGDKSFIPRVPNDDVFIKIYQNDVILKEAANL